MSFCVIKRDDEYECNDMNTLVSVIIPTLKSGKGLEHLLQELSLQNDAKTRLQVICINNLTSFFHPNDFAKWNDRFYQFIYLNSGIKNVNVARNIGIRYATGSLFWFLDDDCELPHQNYLVRIVELHRQNLSFAGIGGHYLLSEENSPSTASQTYHQLSMGWLKKNQSQQLLGGNASYKRYVFDQGLNFDTRINYGGAETGFNQKLVTLGFQLMLCHEMDLVHNCRMNYFDLAYKGFKQGRGAFINDKVNLVKLSQAHEGPELNGFGYWLYQVSWNFGVYLESSFKRKTPLFYIISFFLFFTIKLKNNLRILFINIYYRIFHRFYYFAINPVVQKIYYMGKYHIETYILRKK